MCYDFDFCENCEATVPHEHPFIKINDTKHFREKGWGFGGNQNRGGFLNKLLGNAKTVKLINDIGKVLVEFGKNKLGAKPTKHLTLPKNSPVIPGSTIEK